jgi:DNA processing protein
MPIEHWLQLSLTPGLGPTLIHRLIELTGSTKAACAADATTLQMVQGIGSAKSQSIARGLAKALAAVEPELKRAANIGARIICPDDTEYPPLLKLIPDPAVTLYLRGNIEPRDLNAVAIDGSRKCSFYGREQAERFATLLSGAGVTVLSGGARGVDSSAHRGAIQQPNGRTIAVLGSGLDVVYPPENKTLFDQIAEGHGAVISEFPMGTQPLAENFPRRNRIVSGMSRGVLVIEADVRSGALITARQAADDHNRTVFAIPGRLDNPLSAGPHALIRDGAVLVTNLEDILEHLGPLPELIEQPVNETSVLPAHIQEQQSLWIDPHYQAILDHMDHQPATADELIDRTGLSAGELLRQLTLMTLKGLVRREDGQRFSKISRGTP